MEKKSVLLAIECPHERCKPANNSPSYGEVNEKNSFPRHMPADKCKVRREEIYVRRRCYDEISYHSQWYVIRIHSQVPTVDSSGSWWYSLCVYPSEEMRGGFVCRDMANSPKDFDGTGKIEFKIKAATTAVCIITGDL